jgi:hypothetical protein
LCPNIKGSQNSRPRNTRTSIRLNAVRFGRGTDGIVGESNLAKTGGTQARAVHGTIASDADSALRLMRKPGGGLFVISLSRTSADRQHCVFMLATLSSMMETFLSRHRRWIARIDNRDGGAAMTHASSATCRTSHFSSKILTSPFARVPARSLGLAGCLGTLCNWDFAAYARRATLIPCFDRKKRHPRRAGRPSRVSLAK